jgi:hypothetical protein
MKNPKASVIFEVKTLSLPLGGFTVTFKNKCGFGPAAIIHSV